MNLTYDNMKDYLNKRYEYNEGQTKGFYFNELGQIVATINEKTITAFYKQTDINKTLPDLYAVSIIKNLYVGKDEEKKVIDAMYIQPLYSNTNDVQVYNNFAVEMYENKEINKGELGAIGIAIKGEANNRHFINEEIDIEIPKREYQEKNLFTLYGVYLLNLQTKGVTDKLDYNKVSEYYKKRIQELDNPNIPYLIQKHAMEYLEERTHQSYDGLINPIINETEANMSEMIKEKFISKTNNEKDIEIIEEKVKKKVI